MNSLPLVLAPFGLLLLPVLGQSGGAAPEAMKVLEDARRTPYQQQVRIEQHVVIRIAPGPVDVGQRFLNEFSARPERQRFKEKKLDGCVPIAAIAAVRPAPDNRLILYLRDRQVISAVLERSCRPEEFYQGAYVARGEDGRLCPRRDRLQSRTGANCQVAKLLRLVPRD